MIKSRFKRALAAVFAAAMLVTAIPGISAAAASVEYDPSSSYKNSSYYKSLLEVELTGDQAIDVANVAKSQIGYHESSSSSDLSGHSSGSGNCTEYSRWYGNQGSYWCNIFVSWCGYVAGVSPSVFPKLTSVNYSYNNIMPAAGAKCFKFSHGSELEPGDIIFCCTCSGGYGCMDHVGLVVDVDSDYIYTAEGNMSNKVSSVKYPVATGYSSYYHSRINYVARPDYGINTVDLSSVKKADAVSCKNGVIYSRYDVSISAEDAVSLCKITNSVPAPVNGKAAVSAASAVVKTGTLERYYVNKGKGKTPDSILLTNGKVTDASGRKRITGLVTAVNTNGFKPVNTACFAGKKVEIYDNAVPYQVAAEFARSRGGKIASLENENDLMLLSLLFKQSDAYYILKDGKLCAVLNDGTEKITKAANIERSRSAGFIVVYDAEEKVTVTYDANGGENTPIETVCVKGDSVKITDAQPVKEKRVFAGWSTDPEAKQADFSGGESFKAIENTTLYAVWAKQ